MGTVGTETSTETVGQKHSRVGMNRKEYKRKVIPNIHTNLWSETHTSEKAHPLVWAHKEELRTKLTDQLSKQAHTLNIRHCNSQTYTAQTPCIPDYELHQRAAVYLVFFASQARTWHKQVLSSICWSTKQETQDWDKLRISLSPGFFFFYFDEVARETMNLECKIMIYISKTNSGRVI